MTVCALASNELRIFFLTKKKKMYLFLKGMFHLSILNITELIHILQIFKYCIIFNSINNACTVSRYHQIRSANDYL